MTGAGRPRLTATQLRAHKQMGTNNRAGWSGETLATPMTGLKETEEHFLPRSIHNDPKSALNGDILRAMNDLLFRILDLRR